MSKQEAFEKHMLKTYGERWQEIGYPPHEIIGVWQASADNTLKRVIGIIENYQVPVGNSPAGEMACEWTMAALKDIRDEILNRENE